MIDIESVSISFGTGSRAFRAVNNVSFRVAPGEAFGLVGESGSGKSTLLRAIAGLSTNVEGTIKINDTDLSNTRSRASRRFIQMVHQDPYSSLHPTQTVDQTLSAPIAIHRLGNASERIMAALEEVGLGAAHRFRYPHQLSGGQRQRVAIARALILQPSILLLDEPTSALDVSVQAEVLNLLKRLNITRKLTMLMVSHDLAVVTHICGRIGIMRRGHLLETVTADDLIEGRLADNYSRHLLQTSRELGRDSTEFLSSENLSVSEIKSF